MNHGSTTMVQPKYNHGLQHQHNINRCLSPEAVVICGRVESYIKYGNLHALYLCRLRTECIETEINNTAWDYTFCLYKNKLYLSDSNDFYVVLTITERIFCEVDSKLRLVLVHNTRGISDTSEHEFTTRVLVTRAIHAVQIYSRPF